VDIDHQVPEFTSYGEEVGYLWEPYLENVPAEVLTGPGREFNAADAKQAETTARINLRWFPGLLPDMRIRWEGQRYDILSIETDVTARKEYRLRCKQGANDGA
jgi:SPP1 family predicted phage head-tail adaptor